MTAETRRYVLHAILPKTRLFSTPQGILTSMRLSSLMALTLVSTWLDDNSSRATKKFPPGRIPGASSSNEDRHRHALTWTQPSTPTDEHIAYEDGTNQGKRSRSLDFDFSWPVGSTVSVVDGSHPHADRLDQVSPLRYCTVSCWWYTVENPFAHCKSLPPTTPDEHVSKLLYPDDPDRSLISETMTHMVLVWRRTAFCQKRTFVHCYEREESVVVPYRGLRRPIPPHHIPPT